METINSPLIIEKEKISALIFPKDEVLTDKAEIIERTQVLNKAPILGNTEQRKIKIIFKDNKDVLQVETTVWATTENNIILKGGVNIPINRILKVNIF